MNYIEQEQIRPMGDLGARLALLAGRLEDRIYRPESIFVMDVNGWPGDWEGRAILAQTMLSRTTGTVSAYLRENVLALDGQFNRLGYLKGILPEGEFDEQQLSGHGWLLRGLCEYYAYSGDQSALDRAVRIAENLFLPTKGHFADYPCRPEERVYAGEAAGNIAAVVRGWHISTDTGCAFIPMDGLSRLYELTGDPRLAELLDEMIERFLTIDLEGIKAQTHASLSACRAILRMYRLTGKSEYLEAVERIFRLYRRCGMTANYANFNWFHRPEWTEPCAIVDSMIVCMELFRQTGNVEYADLVRNIYCNGIARSQRPNGGFGCDSCADETGLGSGDELFVQTYEASWCCTMRGAEGLAMAARFGYLRDGEDIVVPMFHSSVAELPFEDGAIRIWQRADVQQDGRVEFRVEQNTVQRPIKLRILMPEWTCDSERFREFTVPKTGDSIVLNFEVPVRQVGRRILWGDRMLGSAKPVKDLSVVALRRDKDGFTDGTNRLEPISEGYLMDKEALCQTKLQILFEK